MRRLIFIIVLLLLVGGSIYLVSAGSLRPSSEPAAAVAVGGQAPDFSLTDLDGRVVSLAQLRGKVVLVNFWATWCPPCRAEMPSMEKLYHLLKDEDFVMLAINIEADGEQTVARFLEKNQHSFPILLDTQGVVQKQYGVYKFPETFVIRKDGIIDDKVIGAFDWAHPETVAYFRDLIKG